MRVVTSAVDYDRVWSEWGDMSDNAPTPIHTRRLILNEAANLQFASVLDVGCGSGILISETREHFPGLRYAGADLARTAVERGRRRYPGISFHQLDIETEALPDTFDLVLFSEVVEHLHQPERAVANLRKMCSGHVVLTTPTGPRLPTDLAFHHVKHFTPEELHALISNAGFDVVRLYRWGWPFQTLFRRMINLVPRLTHDAFVRGGNYGLLKRMVSRLWSAVFYLNLQGRGTQLVLVARIR
jgi:2-polyprenyl-3-methyl-5-hydroxy-6-metoxy-1,4-benzoquinol methylase